MSFPQTTAEMEASGYLRLWERDGQCNSCRASLEWWKTPAGKLMPMDAGTATPHWSTCPNANQHRKPSGPDVNALKARISELEAALRELMLMGRHDGECVLDENGKCPVHWAAAMRRIQTAREVLNRC
ncbi:MAG: hypothetical protein ACYCW6_22260 [Candidatus Xenobia bacterium]